METEGEREPKQGPFLLHQITSPSKYVRAAQHRRFPLRRTGQTSHSARPTGAKAQPFRSESSNLYHVGGL
uniref:Uncharacterized protein n=1 Tax=Arundo donax TaxID=35708 RepID=A0A0A8Z4Q9_ARUDO